MGSRKVTVKQSAADNIAAIAWFIESKGMLATAEKFADDAYDYLRINFRNVTPAGSFNFGVNSVQETSCEYSNGNSIIGFQNIHSTSSSGGSGTIIIDSFSDTYISGTFNAKCIGDGGSVVQITSGSFKGKF